MADSVTESKRILLQEYGARVVVPSDLLDLRELEEANRRWSKLLGLSGSPIQAQIHGQNSISLRAEGVTGAIRIGDVDVEIAPKFLDKSQANWQTALWRILEVVEGAHIDLQSTAGNEISNSHLPDLLSEIFISSFRRGTLRGLPTGYQTRRSEGMSLRGQLDTSRIATLIAKPWIVPYVTDLLVEDVPLSRLLKWGATVLSQSVRAPNRAKSLRQIVGSLGHVADHPPNLTDARRIQVGVQHLPLEPAKTVGLLLLEGAAVNHSNGAFRIPGFLWNSDSIYENFIFHLCRTVAQRNGLTVTKHSINFGELHDGTGTQLQTIPDVVFRDKTGLAVAVADSKYKNFGSRPQSGDSYQVFTAAHVLGCRKVSLIFPGQSNQQQSCWRIDSKLGAESVYLTALPIDILAMSHSTGFSTLTDVIERWLQLPVGAQMTSPFPNVEARTW